MGTIPPKPALSTVAVLPDDVDARYLVGDWLRMFLSQVGNDLFHGLPAIANNGMPEAIHTNNRGASASCRCSNCSACSCYWLLNGMLEDGHEFALQRPVIARGALT